MKKTYKMWAVMVHRDEKSKKADPVGGCISHTRQQAIAAFLGVEPMHEWRNRWAQPKGCYSVQRVTVSSH